MPRRALRLLSLLIVCLGLAAAPAALAQSQDSAPKVDTAAWGRTLDLVEQQLGRADTTAENANRFLEVTARIRKQAQALTEELQPKVDSLKARLEALGPPPKQDGTAEAPDVAKQRAALNDELQNVNAQISQAKLAIVRTNELDKQIGSLSQQKRFEKLFRLYPFPWAAATWQESLPEFFDVTGEMLSAPADWWDSVSRDQRRSALSLRVAVLLGLALVVGAVLRRLLIYRYGRDPGVAEPTYSQRFIAAGASAVARGIIPALMFGGLLYFAVTNKSADGDLFWSLMATLFAVLIFFSLAWALPYAMLSPDVAQWRLLPVSPKNARKLGRRFTLLAAFYAIQIFMSAVQERIGVSDAYLSLATLLLNLVPALLVIDMARRRYWVPQLEPQEATDGEEDEVSAAATMAGGFWGLVRKLSALTAAASIVAAVVGYADLSNFLITGLLESIVTLGIVAIVRGLGRELIGAGLRSGFMREALELRHVARSRLKFWLRGLLDVALLVVGVMGITAVWTAPFGEFWVQAKLLLTGITIGGVKISLYAILTAIGVFAVTLLVTRLGQRLLNNRILPQTGFDTGVQNSLSAGFGYIGIILAAILGISVLGIDLSNIALIAGALSVGIGFGLQTIVSNFVSGIILLIERPIKVGDWVVVGSNEGFVKRITVRSTELETFQRASVIIPNSDFISTAVVNWTHKDRYGRIELPVGVAYGSDVEKVREILLDIAQHHEGVLTSPEPQVVFMDFGSSSLDFELRCFTNEVTYRLFIASDMRFAIDKAFREAGIEIPFPQRVVHFAERPIAIKSMDPKGKDRPETT